MLQTAVGKITTELIGLKPEQVTSPEQMEKLLDSIDPMMLSEWCNIMFHLKQDSTAYPMAKLIISQSSDPVSVANCHNFLASSFRRNGNQELGSEHDRQGLTLLKSIPDFENNPTAIWQSLKMEHGLLTSRSFKKPHSDMVDQFVSLAERRRQLGDVMQIGRSYLDAGRIAHQVGDEEKAIYYLELAFQQLNECGYTSSAIDALNLIGQIKKTKGEERQARRVWVKGVEFVRDLEKIMPEKVREVVEKKDSLFKVPADCLLEISPDQFLLEFDDNGKLATILLDQESNKNGEAILRNKLGNLLSVLADREIKMPQRKTGVYLKAKEERENKKNYLYKVEIDLPEDILALLKENLDKNTKKGYIIMSWSELLRQIEDVGEELHHLVELEKTRHEQ